MTELRRISSFALLAIVLAVGCDRPTPSPQPASSQEPVVGASTSAIASASASVSASATASVPAVVVDPASAKKWSGTYETKRVELATPPKVTDFTWKNDDGSKAVGNGRLSMIVADGVVGGEASGALGSQVLSGLLDGTLLRLELIPTDPTVSSAMSGGGTGELKDGVISGTMRVAGPKGVEVREVTFKLEPSGQSTAP